MVNRTPRNRGVTISTTPTRKSEVGLNSDKKKYQNSSEKSNDSPWSGEMFMKCLSYPSISPFYHSVLKHDFSLLDK